MIRRDPPDAATLNSLLKLDTETGQLHWKARPLASFGGDLRACNSWNARFSGKIAFQSTNNHGYKVGAIYGKTCTAHRVIWCMTHGDMPRRQIDHINGDRTDNRVENLREVTNSTNHKNQKLPSTNTSGAIGVCMEPRTGKWVATIYDNGNRFYLGKFESIDDAIAARKEAEIELGYHANHGRKDG